MAKFGEGDSRWIVEDRADGKNVNSWHWEEKNITPKAKERFIFHLNNAVLVENEGGVTVTVDGVDVTAAEATMMNRRGRMRCIFEITAKVKWTGSKVAADGEKLGSANGSYEIEEFTHDGPEECEIKTTLNDSKPGVPAEIYAVVKSAGIKSLKAKLSAFLQETIAACLNVDESRKAAGVPATGASPSPSPSPSPVVAKKSLEQSPATSNATFQTITSSYDFASEPQNLFECFVDVARFCAITQGPAKVSANAGGEIEFFNGSVTGSVVESIPGRKLVQKWRFSDWTAGHFSKVTLEFKESGTGRCKIELTHEFIPRDSVERVKHGWNKLIMDRIHTIFGL